MRIRKIMAVTMAACLVAGSLAGCGKKTEEKVIKIGVFEPTTGENGHRITVLTIFVKSVTKSSIHRRRAGIRFISSMKCICFP